MLHGEAAWELVAGAQPCCDRHPPPKNSPREEGPAEKNESRENGMAADTRSSAFLWRLFFMVGLEQFAPLALVPPRPPVKASRLCSCNGQGVEAQGKEGLEEYRCC